ncbi:hypothetical protein E1287_37605 [Actinomadura sp. KC06]|uniref:hypothetical protein n=1 Tax=Actinomadura sp. KC06 TaxID=2530369 RepID=UPI0010518C0D|nr:hypothetical protein [Actinomadura sp. KC06]TDD25051.1 hypothetical protein E1287_37605 [Actinomadura sp. KC06]
MARTAVTATRLTGAGIDPGDVDVAAQTTDGNSFAWTANALLYVLNGDDAELTVTVPTPVTVGRGALAVADTTITIPAGEYRIAGPFGPEHVQTDGTVHVNYTGTTPTGVMVAVLDAARA